MSMQTLQTSEMRPLPKTSIVNVPIAVFLGLGALLGQSVQASTIEGINHTHWAINHFSVDGRSGIDIIGPYQGGGGGVATSPRSAGNGG